jgi:superfamily I DNA and/or RNA helicase
MHEHIMSYSSKVFYQGLLRAHDSVANRLVHAEQLPVEFVDTAGCGFDEKLENTAISNPEEAAFLLKHLTQLLQSIGGHYTAETLPTIAVISPYREQVHVLHELLDHAPELQPYRSNTSVNTIDGFQGQERDIVYISMVRSNTEGIIGFLSDIRRMNVAMTRARKKLVVIGDSATLSRLPFYADFIAYTEEMGFYRSAWEYMY